MDTCSDDTPFLTDLPLSKTESGSNWVPLWLCACLAISISCNVVSILKVNGVSRSWSSDSFCASHVERYGTAKYRPRSCGVRELTKRTPDSPLLQELDIKFHTVSYNGSFMKETVYRGKPSPEVDAAWSALGADCKFRQRQHHQISSEFLTH